MRTKFFNPQLITKIQKQTAKLMAEWNLDRNDRSVIFQMVATIETGLTEKTFYRDNGIIYDGWNGYKGCESGKEDLNPITAWGGFYRQEKYQWLGWSLYLMENDMGKGTTGDELCRRWDELAHAYGFSSSTMWENTTNIWGYINKRNFFSESDANEFITCQMTLRGYKRNTKQFSEMSGCWTAAIETTKKPANKLNGISQYRKRIEK